MADIITQPINGRALKRHYIDNGDGSFSEEVAVSVAGGGATADNQTTEITVLQTIANNQANSIPTGANNIGIVKIDPTTSGVTNAVTLTSTSGGGSGSIARVTSPTVDSSAAQQCLYVSTQGSNFNGSTWDRIRGDINGSINQPFAMASSRWQYAPPTGGITNSTTAVVLMAAAGTGVRNYLARLQIATSTLATGSEVVVLDGATVIWRGYVGTVSSSQDHLFDVPLRGTANTSMSVQMVTASATGNVYCSAQGFQSAV